MKWSVRKGLNMWCAWRTVDKRRWFPTWREAYDYAHEQAVDYYLDNVFSDPWRA